MQIPRPKSRWSRCLWIVATYSVATNAVPVLLFVLVDCGGYLLYSDRPGPGWQPAHLPPAAELRFFADFSVSFWKATAIYGLAFAAVGLVLSLCALPKWTIRVFATLSAFVASGIIMSAAGWMIAISPTGVFIAAGCGALWGLFLYPYFVSGTNRTIPMAARIALASVVFVASFYWLVKPLLPTPGLTNAKIEVIRRDNSGVELAALNLSYVGSTIARQTTGSGLYRSVARMEFQTDSRNESRVLLIIDDLEALEHTFQIPLSGDAIYRQQRDAWKRELSFGPDSRISVKLSAQNGIDLGLETQGPCCSSMTQHIEPH